ncbi:hypothetical protein [Flavobacterium hercynium]|uniref:Lipoprotein n=1 Tax=Flavobacterium hercynium TaxID=387094 RepID=A0A226HJ61_9FLAO|nr:hypothetical protein [Flavobacterium hercynium]OXA94369.1 hypothetical protein B0A66_04750 [Flavobacterium hercynium]SMP29226.1 hypothetical protein SAMN06265346_11239 [Flavobacterium hercynium]
MKKAKLLPILLVLIILQSCNSQTNKKPEQEMKKTKVSKPFDLHNLTFDEEITDILSSANLSKKDTVKNEQLTSMGNERLVFESKNLLTFNKTNLANKNSLGTNNVMFHYGKIDPEIGALNNEKNNIIGMYQINLFTKFESDELSRNLNLLFGKPKNVYKLGPINTFLWVNNNICYYYFTKDNDEFYRVLFVYKKTDREWVDFIGYLGFDSGNLKSVN